ncbi:DgyrCDS5178 [Dimorphilus gyrociliatus]|uniref:DgyrCDS5178 n=1 Tax=Dimorphilus gyrociliatus TaxID=2664684 RepID=A0A7I8VKP7_9ANNE|nr:DgyrCDS5178 [Dimorphilus gyrociliatus]
MSAISRRLCLKHFQTSYNVGKRFISSEGTMKNIITERMGSVFLVSINRPDKRNCVNPEAADELSTAFRQFEKDDTLSVAVLYGKGGNFCAGYDLKSLSKVDESFQLPDHESGYGPLGPTRMLFKKPVIAAVSGYAVAGGLELSLMCDMRIADETAIFGVFCRRFGVPLIDGGTVRLPKLIGLSRAMDMILTGRPIDAKEALSFGLANRVVPVGTAVGEAVKIAQQISKFPSKCMKADRTSAYYTTYAARDFRDAVTYEWDHSVGVVLEESVKGAQNFVSGEGRKGNFDLKESKL